MKFFIKKLTFIVLFNITLLIFLFISIQNSKYRSKVNFILFETIPVPISFISGSSFIFGTLAGSLTTFSKNSKIN
tara:strand:- start:373 stop:597 length:225 start_codon:yes stop_codon:yes gene_type:complete